MRQRNTSFLNRNLYQVTPFPIFQNALKDAQPEEFSTNLFAQQMKEIDYNSLSREDKIIQIKNLLIQKDIYSAAQLGIDIGIVQRVKNFIIMGQPFNESDFIAISDLSQQCLFYGIIKYMIIINIEEEQLPYVQIQILFDGHCFINQNIEFNPTDLIDNFGKERVIYSQKELIGTDQYTFIEIRQILSKIEIDKSIVFAEFSQEKKNNLKNYYYRFKYFAKEKKLRLMDNECQLYCNKKNCQKLFDPYQDVRICIGCKKEYIHFACISKSCLHGDRETKLQQSYQLICIPCWDRYEIDNKYLNQENIYDEGVVRIFKTCVLTQSYRRNGKIQQTQFNISAPDNLIVQDNLNYTQRPETINQFDDGRDFQKEEEDNQIKVQCDQQVDEGDEGDEEDEGDEGDEGDKADKADNVGYQREKSDPIILDTSESLIADKKWIYIKKIIIKEQEKKQGQ